MRTAILVAALSLLVSGSAWAEAAKVTYLQGSAELARGNKAFAPMKKGATVKAGDRIRTNAKTRVEVTFPDTSRIRIGQKTEVSLDVARFEGKKRKAVGATVTLGRIWAKVAKAVGAGSKFEVSTKNAVGGVRGTSFTVIAASDSSALVRVYAGTVGVKKKKKKTGPRVQVAGPQQVDKRQWEERVATAMKQVRISALGEISPAEDFEAQGDEVEWAQWNTERDGPHN